MHVRDWKYFLEHGSREPIGIAQVSAEIVAYLKAKSDVVYLHHDYAKKSVKKHRLSADHFPMIFETVDYGTAIADRDGRMTFLHCVDGHCFQVTVKCAPKDGRIYIVTFYKQRRNEVERKKRHHTILRQ
jgi:hypothetical protein